jgi:plasmid stability protein
MDSSPATPETVAAEPVDDREGISQPSKLIRIAAMTRAMLDEARQAPLDDGGRRRLAAVHAKSLDELRPVLSEELQDEFNEIMIPLNTDGVTEAELRVAQAQLIGWLEGLFHGIQATL